MGHVASVITIREEFKDAVTAALEKRVGIAAGKVTEIVSDGAVSQSELFAARHHLRKFPSSRSLQATAVATYFDSNFFARYGLHDQETDHFFRRLFDNTFTKAAVGGESDEVIDRQEEVDLLRRHLQQTVAAHTKRLAEPLRALKAAMAERAGGFIQEKDVSVKLVKPAGQEDKIAQARVVIEEAPIGIEWFKELFYDQATTVLPEVASQLYAGIKEIPGKTREGILTRSLIYTPNYPFDQEAYVLLTLSPGCRTTEKRKCVLGMRQLSEQEKRAYSLPDLDHEMGYLEGSVILQKLKGGKTNVELIVTAKPDLAMIPNFLETLIVEKKFPMLLLGAARSIGAHLITQQYYCGFLDPHDSYCLK